MSVLLNRTSGGSHDDSHEIDTEGSWAISYGDMITLLLTFFILFFSTDQEKDRMDRLESSLIAKFNGVPAASTPMIGEGGKEATVEQAVADRFQVQAFKVGNKVIIDFPGTSFFDLGKIDVTKSGQEELRKFVELYLPYAGSYTLGIRAFTDNRQVIRSPGRRFNDNLELSALRSVAAMRVLQQSGIPLRRMRLGGFGELSITADELQRTIASTNKLIADPTGLARKIVLVIEPETEKDIR